MVSRGSPSPPRSAVSPARAPRPRSGCRRCAPCRSGCGTARGPSWGPAPKSTAFWSAFLSFRHGVDGRKAAGLRDRLEHPREVLAATPGPRGDRPPLDRKVWVAHHQLRVDLEAGAEAVAVRAGAVGGVEAEVAGRQLVEGQAAGRAGQMLAEDQGFLGSSGLSVSGPSRAPASTSCTSATPSARRSAVSNESVSRRSIPSRLTKRSTTTSMVWFS